VSSSSELLLSLPAVAARSGFGVPFRLVSVGLSGVVPASFPVGAGGVVLASFSVGAGGTVPASFSVGVLVPSSDPPSARSIKSPRTLLSSFSFSFPLVDGVGGGGLLLLSGDGGGTDIPWSAGGIPWSAGGIPWSVGSIPWSAGGTDGEMVRSRLAILRSSMPR